jgi:nucleoid DNA-binding protein
MLKTGLSRRLSEQNPHLYATIDVPEKRYPSFRMAKEMLLRLNRVSPKS